MTRKFKLQSRFKPERLCTIDLDDRSICCGSEIMHFEADDPADPRIILTVRGKGYMFSEPS